MAYGKLIQAGYIEIGMDHFALKTDQLAKAMDQKTLHRNFMGYADLRTDVLLGLGVSSISESPDCFHQNEKVLPVFQRLISENKIPTLRGHKLNESDRRHREQILKFMTRGEADLEDQAQEDDVRGFLGDMINDGLVMVANKKLQLTVKGKPFLRNACVALDERLRLQKPSTKVFSQAL
jgi:oxygen-independent coproporphyrinogen-3 oxidase